MARGPRILFKSDDASPIGRGAVMYAGHFRPEMSVLIWAAAKTALPEWREITVTEGWRPWDGDGRDLHPELRALDFSLNHIPGAWDNDPARFAAGTGWAHRMLALLPDATDYQYSVHGEGRGLHMHWELDP